MKYDLFLFFALSSSSLSVLLWFFLPILLFLSFQETLSDWRQSGCLASARTRRMKWWAASWTSTTWRASSTCFWWRWASVCWSSPGNTCCTGNCDTPFTSLTKLTSCWPSVGWDLWFSLTVKLFLWNCFSFHWFSVGLLRNGVEKL